MSSVSKTYDGTTMHEIVSANKSDMLNSGVVSDSETQAKSTLTKADVSFAVGETSAPVAGHSPKKAAQTRKVDQKTEQATTATSCHSGDEPSRGVCVSSAQTVEGTAAKSRFHTPSIRRIAASKLANQFEEESEFEGVPEGYDVSATARSVAAGVRQHRNVKAANAVSDTTTTQSTARRARKTARITKDASLARKASAEAKAAERIVASSQTGAVAERVSTAKTLGAATSSAAAPVLGVLAGILAFVFAVLVVSQAISALFGFWENEASKRSMVGLPPYITYAMVEEALACQEEFGHPAGCTLAQIICESGQGDHMSQLATRDHNLFGMKWAPSFASAPEVSGKANWVTGEEYGGTQVTITDAFTVFVSDVDCIRFRSRVFLQATTYAQNATIQEAIANHDSDKMAEGLKSAGWATSSTYVETLVSIMDTYNLRRFDSMTVADLANSAADGNTIVEAAYTQLGVPYVWGGSTPGVGLDCSGLTQYCYAQAGISIPHYTEDQARELAKIPLSQAQPGDILYKSGHVAIFIGGDSYIHEPQSGDVCRIASGISYFECALTARLR